MKKKEKDRSMTHPCSWKVEEKERGGRAFTLWPGKGEGRKIHSPCHPAQEEKKKEWGRGEKSIPFLLAEEIEKGRSNRSCSRPSRKEDWKKKEGRCSFYFHGKRKEGNCLSHPDHTRRGKGVERGEDLFFSKKKWWSSLISSDAMRDVKKRGRREENNMPIISR